MNRPELYKKTVDILFQAYFNDTLKHGDCSACAVGNICLGNGIERIWMGIVGSKNNAVWGEVFRTNSVKRKQFIFEENYKGVAKEVIDVTGYKWQELARIEKAFELADKGSSEEDHMYNGLVAVLDVLKEIHEVEDDSQEQIRFKQHYQTLTA